MSEMNYAQLKKSLDSKELKNLYMLSGETDLVGYFEKRILSEALGENFTDFDYTTIKGEDFSNENFRGAVNTLPMMTAKKCVLLKDLPFENLDSNDLKILFETLSDIPEFSVVVISWSGGVLGAKHSAKLIKLQNLVKKIGVFAALLQKDFPISRQISAWVKRDFGKEIEPSCVKKIIDFCKGYQIHEMKSEVKKICEFEKGEKITDDSLEIIWKSKAKTSIFELPKALSAGNGGKAFEVLSELLTQGEEPYVILSVIAGEYNDIYRAKLLLQAGENPSRLAEFFDYKNKQFRIKNAEKIARKMSMSEIKEIIFMLAKADMNLKSTAIDPKTVLSQVLTFILLKLKNL